MVGVYGERVECESTTKFWSKTPSENQRHSPKPEDEVKASLFSDNEEG